MAFTHQKIYHFSKGRMSSVHYATIFSSFDPYFQRLNQKALLWEEPEGGSEADKIQLGVVKVPDFVTAFSQDGIESEFLDTEGVLIFCDSGGSVKRLENSAELEEEAMKKKEKPGEICEWMSWRDVFELSQDSESEDEGDEDREGDVSE